MADALSIEQNNKIRVALGLKPLPVPGAGPEFQESDSDSGAEEEEEASTVDTRQAAGYDNWQKHQDAADAKRKREEKNAAIKKARELAQRNIQLKGPTLGEENGAELDTKAWLAQTKKRTKKIEQERARRTALELEERERLATAEYTAADLAGIKVGHSAGDFDGEEDHILTLKDVAVDDDDEMDELQDTNLLEKEKLEEKLELKKKKPVYDPTQEGQAILSQYDDDGGKKRKLFTLDAKGSTEEREAKRLEVSKQLRKNVINLEFEPEVPASDYMDISEVKIKKPKKKKARTTKQRAVMDDEDLAPPAENDAQGGSAMDVDSSAGVPVPARRKPATENVSFADDDDLQASLALQRRAAFKKRKKISPEELARQLREEETKAEDEGGNDNEDEPGLIIAETSEFVAKLKPTLESQEKPKDSPKPAPTPTEEPTKPEPTGEGESVEIDMDRYGDIDNEEELAERIKRDEASKAQPEISGTGLEEESTLDEGLGATLKMLRSRGLVKDNDGGAKNALTRDRERFLADKANRENETERRARQQRELDRSSGKLDRMSAREREDHARWRNEQRDQQEARHMAEVFEGQYKPDVNLRYVDEFGRDMNQKEAFKQLSHQFHGKGSGKMKTEKRLKKIEEEKKRESMSTLDTSDKGGMNNAVGTAARNNREAGVRLG